MYYERTNESIISQVTRTDKDTGDEAARPALPHKLIRFL